ncbi:hypothetical protein FACS1894178_2740 [Bacteroidia bacterium]|nr:hypothetical protein FACS1894178_2740 [Bacteroidia bacterium]
MKLINSIIKNLWKIIIVLAIITIVLGTIGFCKQSSHCNGFYEAIRLLTINHQFEMSDGVNCFLQIARWLGVVTFALFSLRVFLLLIPNWRTKRKIKGFKNHYVIFGQDELCSALIKKITYEKNSQEIVHIVDKEVSKEDYKKYQSETLKIIEGNPLKDKKDTDKVFRDANLIKASKFFAVCLEDNQNVEIAKNVWEYLGKHPETKKRIIAKEKLPKSEQEKLSIKESTAALRCYTLVKDNDFKNIVEESPIFKYKRKDEEVFYFDGVTFNNVGVQYGVNMLIQEILPEKWGDNPNILIVGYDDFAIAVMLNLSHILTKNHEKLNFHIITNDENAENHFKKKYEYLYNFVEIKFYGDLEEFDLKKITLSSIFVCNNDNSKAVSVAVAIRYKLKKNEPYIFLLTRNPNYLEKVFNVPNTEKKDEVLTLNKYNIKIFNSLNYFWDLVINKREKIEDNAKKLHAQYGITNEIERYEYLTETYKQSNRNAALDFYIKTYIFNGNNFDEFIKSDKLIKFTPKEKEYLAEIEHRRWMLEKYSSAWNAYDKSMKDWKNLDKNERDKLKNTYKISPFLKEWGFLEEKTNDIESIELFEKILNEKKTNENIQPTTA